MALNAQLSEYIRACFTGIWIESHEQQDALTEIAQLCQQEGWQLATWNIEQGLRVSGASVDNSSGDPLSTDQNLWVIESFTVRSRTTRLGGLLKSDARRTA